jgi:S-formylglutathione hydrolase FrmB
MSVICPRLINFRLKAEATGVGFVASAFRRKNSSGGNAVAYRHSVRAALICFAILFAVAALPNDVSAQAAVKKGTVEKITVHGNALVGNLAGEPADRTVFVYLPPSYATERNRRYPVAYLLHGYGLTGERWMTFAKMSDAADKVMTGWHGQGNDPGQP